MVTLSTYDAALREAQGKRANFSKAHLLLLRAHENGDARATYALATWHLYGRDPVVEKNLGKAVSLLKQASDANHADALHDLAVCYAKGAGIRKSKKKAALYYLRAAIHGDKQSAYEVGRCYWHGLGVTRDRNVARVWLDYAEKFDIKK
jgi:TPR repeat protein